jgi:deoxyribodipyrimidine photo-lyase
MGRPFREKFADIKWEVNEEHFTAWKEGRTGVPIIDAGMRQLNTMGEPLPTHFYVLRRSSGTTWGLGWMHNRVRMVVAMYLTKDLMLDWRLGERVRNSTPLVLQVFTKV